MEDLDLDELDNAVTQLMDKPKGKPAVKKSAPPTPEIAKIAPEPPKVEPEPDAPVTIAVTQKTPHVSLAKSAPRKRVGSGAMDIIQRPAPPPHRPNREGAALQPTKSVAPELVQSAAHVSTPEPTPPHAEVSDDLLASLNMLEDSNKTVKPKPEAPGPVPEAEAWPDPIDLHGFDDKKPEAPTPEPEPIPPDPTEEPPTLQSVPTPAQEEPAASPFVTTKVEKRPLGAYANTPAHVPEKPADTPVPPAETSKADMAETALASSHHIDKPDGEADMDDLRQMSIPQQYHTAQAKPQEAVHNIFDTREYHAPPRPMRTEHHGSPWFVVSIVAFIVLIIGVAAVGYLMMTGMLDITKIW